MTGTLKDSCLFIVTMSFYIPTSILLPNVLHIYINQVAIL